MNPLSSKPNSTSWHGTFTRTRVEVCSVSKSKAVIKTVSQNAFYRLASWLTKFIRKPLCIKAFGKRITLESIDIPAILPHTPLSKETILRIRNIYCLTIFDPLISHLQKQMEDPDIAPYLKLLRPHTFSSAASQAIRKTYLESKITEPFFQECMSGFRFLEIGISHLKDISRLKIQLNETKAFLEPLRMQGKPVSEDEESLKAIEQEIREATLGLSLDTVHEAWNKLQTVEGQLKEVHQQIENHLKHESITAQTDNLLTRFDTMEALLETAQTHFDQEMMLEWLPILQKEKETLAAFKEKATTLLLETHYDSRQPLLEKYEAQASYLEKKHHLFAYLKDYPKLAPEGRVERYRQEIENYLRRQKIEKPELREVFEQVEANLASGTKTFDLTLANLHAQGYESCAEHLEILFFKYASVCKAGTQQTLLNKMDAMLYDYKVLLVAHAPLLEDRHQAVLTKLKIAFNAKMSEPRVTEDLPKTIKKLRTWISQQTAIIRTLSVHIAHSDQDVAYYQVINRLKQELNPNGKVNPVIFRDFFNLPAIHSLPAQWETLSQTKDVFNETRALMLDVYQAAKAYRQQHPEAKSDSAFTAWYKAYKQAYTLMRTLNLP